MFWRMHVSNFEHLSFFINIQVFYVLFNKSLPIWRLLRYSHMFSSECYSFIFYILVWALSWINFCAFFTQISNCPKYYGLKKFSLPLNWKSLDFHPYQISFNYIYIRQVYFLTLFCTIDLFYILSHCLDYCRLTINIEVWQDKPSNSSLLLKSYFGSSRSSIFLFFSF